MPTAISIATNMRTRPDAPFIDTFHSDPQAAEVIRTAYGIEPPTCCRNPKCPGPFSASPYTRPDQITSVRPETYLCFTCDACGTVLPTAFGLAHNDLRIRADTTLIIRLHMVYVTTISPRLPTSHMRALVRAGSDPLTLASRIPAHRFARLVETMNDYIAKNRVLDARLYGF